MYQQIKTFLAIVECKSISGAAQSLHYTQSTVSTYLNLLETRMGMTLVNRTRGKRTVTITTDGEAFIPLAQRFLEMENALERFIQSRKRKSLRLAASGSAHTHVISYIANKLIRCEPDIDIRLRTVELREIEKSISEQTFDVALVYDLDINHPDIICVPLFLEERCIVCRTDSKLPKGVISPQRLDSAFEISYTGWSNMRLTAWHKQNFPEAKEPFFGVSSLSAISAYMTDPRCWAVVPYNVAMHMIALRPQELSYRQVEPAPVPRSCQLLVSRAFGDREVLEKLLRCFDEYIEERSYLKKYEKQETAIL